MSSTLFVKHSEEDYDLVVESTHVSVCPGLITLQRQGGWPYHTIEELMPQLKYCTVGWTVINTVDS